MSAVMTARERHDLCALIRRREKLSKTEAAQRAAELLADFEQQLGAIHSYDNDETWEAADAAAEEAVRQANRVIAARSVELGIPKEFAPSVGMGWSSRGQNASAARRTELRRMAMTRISAMEKEARTRIEQHSVRLQGQIVSASLTTEAAKVFLEQMPAAPALMPALDARKLLESTRKAREDNDDEAAP
jgi:hypothetical protein